MDGRTNGRFYKLFSKAPKKKFPHHEQIERQPAKNEDANNSKHHLDHLQERRRLLKMFITIIEKARKDVIRWLQIE